eukprot:COSAG01_NODE_44778_length_415_cov_4.221519_1_plen_27_part_10
MLLQVEAFEFDTQMWTALPSLLAPRYD